MTPVELKARREALGLSIKALGEVLGVRTQSITKWEFGENPPRDWSWIDDALTGMEQYQDQLTEELVAAAKVTYEQTAEAALVTYGSRGDFYHWYPEAREREWPSAGLGVPVEIHRAATARAARGLRRIYDPKAVTISEVPRVE
ncbi:helix-turn-helix domain-containing protein [Micrococcaceae sp. AOP34-BR2-30]